MSEYIPYIYVPDDWYKRIASNYGDYARLAMSTENFLKEIPKDELDRVIKAHKKRQERAAFGAFQGMKTKDEEYDTAWQANNGHRKTEPGADTLDQEV